MTVETGDFRWEADVSPRPQAYHDNRDAETYYLVGDALGRGMVRFLEESDSGSTSRVRRTKIQVLEVKEKP